MITDGRGNAIAGGERGGKSHISYKPYGDIHRTDSFGPDISKYKFTGQEEDKESGLMYYKARYYDSRIGRFLQQDSMVFPNQINGMNRMMYVEGNPVGFRDVSGNNISQSLMGAIAGYIMAPEDKKLEGAILGYQYGRNIDKKRNKLTVQKALFKTERFIKNNLLSGDKISRWYNRAFLTLFNYTQGETNVKILLAAQSVDY
jgi:RHS repeat-associated protein